MQDNAADQLNRDIDPDLFAIATLTVTAIGTVATLIQAIISLKDSNRRDMDRPNAISNYENIEDSARDLRSAVERIEAVFEQQQIRTLSNNFESEPRFGTFAVEFNQEEFNTYRKQDQILTQNANSLRAWSLHMQVQVSSNRYPSEQVFTDELVDLVDVSNAIIFDTKTHREQIRLIKASLERIERAANGARRNQN